MTKTTTNSAGAPAAASSAAESKAANAPATAPVTTESLTAGLRAALTGEAAPESGQEPPPETVETDPNLVKTEEEKTTEETAGANPEPESEVEPEETKQWPKSAIDTITAVRADRRELKNKLTEREKETEALSARVSELEQMLQGAPKAAGGPPMDPLASDPAIVKLRGQVEQHGAVAAWTANQLERLESEGLEAVNASLAEQGVKQTFTTEAELSAWLKTVGANASEEQRKLSIKLEVASERATEKATQLNEELCRQAFEVYPWHKDKESPEHKMVAELVAKDPWIKNIPGWPLLMGDLVEGMKARQARTAKSGDKSPAPTAASQAAAKPAKPTAKLPGNSTAIPQRVEGDAPNSAALFKKFQQTGDPKDREAWVKSTLSGFKAD